MLLKRREYAKLFLCNSTPRYCLHRVRNTVQLQVIVAFPRQTETLAYILIVLYFLQSTEVPGADDRESIKVDRIDPRLVFTTLI